MKKKYNVFSRCRYILFAQGGQYAAKASGAHSSVRLLSAESVKITVGLYLKNMIIRIIDVCDWPGGLLEDITRRRLYTACDSQPSKRSEIII